MFWASMAVAAPKGSVPAGWCAPPGWNLALAPKLENAESENISPPLPPPFLYFPSPGATSRVAGAFGVFGGYSGAAAKEDWLPLPAEKPALAPSSAGNPPPTGTAELASPAEPREKSGTQCELPFEPPSPPPLLSLVGFPGGCEAPPAPGPAPPCFRQVSNELSFACSALLLLPPPTPAALPPKRREFAGRFRPAPAAPAPFPKGPTTPPAVPRLSPPPAGPCCFLPGQIPLKLH